MLPSDPVNPTPLASQLLNVGCSQEHGLRGISCASEMVPTLPYPYGTAYVWILPVFDAVLVYSSPVFNADGNPRIALTTSNLFPTTNK